MKAQRFNLGDRVHVVENGNDRGNGTVVKYDGSDCLPYEVRLDDDSEAFEASDLHPIDEKVAEPEHYDGERFAGEIRESFIDKFRGVDHFEYTGDKSNHFHKGDAFVGIDGKVVWENCDSFTYGCSAFWILRPVYKKSVKPVYGRTGRYDGVHEVVRAANKVAKRDKDRRLAKQCLEDKWWVLERGEEPKTYDCWFCSNYVCSMCPMSGGQGVDCCREYAEWDKAKDGHGISSPEARSAAADVVRKLEKIALLTGFPTGKPRFSEGQKVLWDGDWYGGAGGRVNNSMPPDTVATIECVNPDDAGLVYKVVFKTRGETDFWNVHEWQLKPIDTDKSAKFTVPAGWRVTEQSNERIVLERSE